MFSTIKKIYTSEDLSWTKDSDISAVMMMKWISMNPQMLGKLYYLDKYTFRIPNRMMLGLLSSKIFPKFPKTPFVKYIKKKVLEKEEFHFLLPQIQKYFNYSDNEFAINKKYIMRELRSDIKYYFDFFGVDEKYYKQYKIKLEKIQKIVEKKGLNMFFGGM